MYLKVITVKHAYPNVYLFAKSVLTRTENVVKSVNGDEKCLIANSLKATVSLSELCVFCGTRCLYFFRNLGNSVICLTE
jgi:hypothetical protein